MIDVGEPRFWNLKGQGNANAVFAYVGNTRELVSLARRPYVMLLNLGNSKHFNDMVLFLKAVGVQDCLVLRIPKASDSRVLRSDAFDSLETSIWSPVLAPSISGTILSFLHRACSLSLACETSHSGQLSVQL